ncbi:Control of competence regulator ComK, YlbF/YmcA [Eubacterium ruminantium]|nr:Control of competence regulator ComK, YlbF/YmcA [Eubacterium ruminantium]
MDELLEECKKLNSMIKNSKEYKKYVSARNHLRRNEDLERKLRELYARNREIQEYSSNAFEETQKLYEENDELLHNSLVNEYIRAESALRRLLKNIMDTTAADIIFNYLDEGV